MEKNIKNYYAKVLFVLHKPKDYTHYHSIRKFNT